MNKRRLFSAAALTALLALHSCDTRDDYFYEHCDPPMVTVQETSGDWVDTLSTGERYIALDIDWGETRIIQFDYTEPYGMEITETDIEIRGYGVDEKGRNYLDPAYLNGDVEKTSSYPFNDKYVEFKVDKANKTLFIRDKTETPLDRINKDRMIESVLYCYIYLYMRNSLGKGGYATLEVRFRSNRSPDPVITVTEGSHEREMVISVDGNDPNGDEIDKYEYCIDGNVISHSMGYEIEGIENFDLINSYVAEKSGEAAFNGTYITATSLSKIKHVFQEEGTHTIFVRCRDKWGYWSDWRKKEIVIN